MASPKADITVLSALGTPLVASGVLGDNQFMLSRAAQESDPGPYELIGKPRWAGGGSSLGT